MNGTTGPIGVYIWASDSLCFMNFSKWAKFYCTIQVRVFQKTLARRISLADISKSDVTESSSDSVKFIGYFFKVMIYLTAG